MIGTWGRTLVLIEYGNESAFQHGLILPGAKLLRGAGESYDAIVQDRDAITYFFKMGQHVRA